MSKINIVIPVYNAKKYIRKDGFVPQPFLAI